MIGYVGDFTKTWTTETHVAAAFAELGVEVERIDHLRVGSDGQLRKLVAAHGLDWLVYAPGHNGLSPHGLRNCGVPTVAYHLDRFFGLARQQQIGVDPMWQAHVVCTPDAEPHAWSAHGVYHVPVRAAVHGPEAVDVEPDEGLGATFDVLFVGSEAYHPEWPHRRELLRNLRAWYSDRLMVVPGKSGVRVHGEALNRLYATAKVVVGDSCFAHGGARYWSDRPYEVWGRGGFLIMPRIYALSNEIGSYPGFTPYQWPALHDLIDQFLERPVLREEIRGRVAAKVRADCTYRQRAVELSAALASYGEVAA